MYGWIEQAEAQFAHEQMRLDFARLFSNLVSDWVQSMSSGAEPQPAAADEMEV